jgi:hypothetical protein
LIEIPGHKDSKPGRRKDFEALSLCDFVFSKAFEDEFPANHGAMSLLSPAGCLYDEYSVGRVGGALSPYRDQ